MSNFDTLDAALFADNLRNILTSYEGGIEEFVRAGSDVILGTAQNLRREAEVNEVEEVRKKLMVTSTESPCSSLQPTSGTNNFENLQFLPKVKARGRAKQDERQLCSFKITSADRDRSRPIINVLFDA